MATALDLITESYDLLNHPGDGQDLSAKDAQNALEVLNRLLDSLTLRRLIPYYVQQETFNLVDGTNSYTIGSGGDFNTTRPNRILHATLNSGGNNYSMEQINYDQWMDVFTKGNKSSLPYWFYYEKNNPLAKIYIYETPNNSSSTITIASEKTFGNYALTDTVSLPPGYDRMIIYNLAKELYPKFPTETEYGVIDLRAKESISDIKSANYKDVMNQSRIDYNMIYGYNSDRRFFWNGN